MHKKPVTERKESKGFTLTEVLITIVIVGILSAVALPSYFRQVQRTRQNEAAATLAQLLSIVAAYEDEFGESPTTWQDLNDISAVMSDSGLASGSLLPPSPPTGIVLPGRKYFVKQINDSADLNTGYYMFEACPFADADADDDCDTNQKTQPYNVMACVDLATGASDIKLGMKDADAQIEAPDLNCQ